MNKTSLTSALFVAGALAVAGAAQAETFDSPQRAGEASTMTGGAPNALTTNSPYADNTVFIDTRVLGAGPAVVTTYGTTTYQAPTYYYVVPSTVIVPSMDSSDNTDAYSAPGSIYYGD